MPRCLTDCLGSTYIEFDDVEVPAQNLIGQENEGFAIIMSSTYTSLSFASAFDMVPSS